MEINGFINQKWAGYSKDTTYIEINFENKTCTTYWAHNQAQDIET